MNQNNSLKLDFNNQKTGDIKSANVGLAWFLFILSPFFGVGFFFKGIFSWGYLFLALCTINMSIAVSSEFLLIPISLYLALHFLILPSIILVLMFYIFFKGNELSAKYYLSQGYEFAPWNDKELVKYAKTKWKIYLEDNKN